MDLLKKYPTSAMFITFFAVSCISAYLPCIFKQIIILLALISSVVFAAMKKKTNLNTSIKPALLLMSLAVLVSMILSTFSFNIKYEKADNLDGSEDYATVCIEECEYSLSFSSCYTAKIESSDKLPKGTKIIFTTDKGFLQSGTVIEGRILYSSLSNRSSAGFDSESYYLSNGILIEAEDIESTVVGQDGGFSITRMFGNFNKRLSAMFLAHCDRDSGGISVAVLLGNKDHLSDTTQRDFRRIGISHLLVVSGMHFAVFITFLDFGLRKFKLNRILRCTINICFILFFMALTGFSPSVVRAGVMHLIAQLAFLLLKETTPLNSLAIAGTLIILISPYSALDCGMQLSFIAAYSCIAFSKLRNNYILRRKESGKLTINKNRLAKVLGAILEVILLTAAINICTLPIVWVNFGQVSLLSVFSNVIFIPLITILMYLSAIYLLTYPITFIIPFTSFLINSLCNMINTLAAALSAWEFATIPVNYSFALYLLLPAGVLFSLIPIFKKKARLAALITSLSLCTIFFGCVAITEAVDKSNVHINYVTEKKNDGLVIKSSGRGLICDISDGSYTFSRNLTVELEKLHLTEIEAMLFTHYHNKHTQLLGRISDNNILRSIVLPTPIDERETGIYDSLIDLAKTRGIDVLTVPAGGSFTFGDAVITLYDRTYISRSSHPITGAGIEVNGVDCLIVSSSFNESTSELISAADNAEYLILGIHSPVYKKTFGLDFSSEPKAVVYSADSYEHMNEETQNYIDSINSFCGVSEYSIVIKAHE